VKPFARGPTTGAPVDVESLLLQAPGSARLADVVTDAGELGYTLGIAAGALAEHGSMTVSDWLAAGAPGAPSLFSDPADHLVAGLEATLTGGRCLVVPPSPRRAVGPDLIALVIVTRGHLASVDRAWLRLHRRDARIPALPLPAVDLDPPVSLEEAAMMDRIARELTRVDQ